MALSDGAKQRLSIVIEVTKTVFHYSFIPTVLYLGNYFFYIFKYSQPNLICEGFRKGADPGMPEFALSK
jgi:import receptor subunit TOM7